MSKTDTPEALLTVALQDLHDAERAWGERIPRLRKAAGEALAAWLDDEGTRNARQADALAALLDGLDEKHSGDTNIWLRAILKDAARDARSIVAGPLRDLALIGAFRKGKQAERVSYETAIALAEALGRAGDARVLREARDEEAAADAVLAGMLDASVAEAMAAQR